MNRPKVRLPRALENVVQRLSEAEQGPIREAIDEAFADAEVTKMAVRMDSIVGSGYSYWALPDPQVVNLAEKLTAVVVAWETGGTKTAIGLAISTVIYHAIAQYKTRTRLTREQALVLRTIKKAPKSEGWSAEEISIHLPAESGLTSRDVEELVAELRALLDAAGEPVTWKVIDSDGRYWSSNV